MTREREGVREKQGRERGMPEREPKERLKLAEDFIQGNNMM